VLKSTNASSTEGFNPSLAKGDNMEVETQTSTPTVTETLWTVKQAARFLQKSERWIFGQLNIDENEHGSIPHVRLGRSPRFIPDDLRSWASEGFPPAAAFKEWKEADAKRARRYR
jgi:hypothetical protein